MNTIQTGRRNFLTNLAVLSAGAACCTMGTGIFSDNEKTPDLKAAWTRFCQQHKGENYSGTLDQKKHFVPCKGHEHREGPLVYFPGEAVVAQPVWIYWTNRGKPADVVVHVYKTDGTAISMNRFELQLLSGMDKSAKISVQKDLASVLQVNDKGQRVLIAKTTIDNNRASHQYTPLQTTGILA